MHGAPVAFYSDKHTVFRVNRDAKGGPGAIRIQIIDANSLIK
jgi:hypothetical protein